MNLKSIVRRMFGEPAGLAPVEAIGAPAEGTPAENASESPSRFVNQDAQAMLRSLRNGQPIPRMMDLLSDESARWLSYLEAEFARRAQIIKVLAGDPGAGKTTFKQSLASRIAGDPQVISVSMTMAAATHFRPANFVVSLVAARELLVAVVDRLLLLLERDRPQAEAIYEWAQTTKTWHLTRFLFLTVDALLEDGADQAHLRGRLANFHSAMRSWYIEPAGVKKALAATFSHFEGGYGGRVPPAPLAGSGSHEFFEHMAEFVELYRRAGIYPCWAIDEFESVTELYSAPQLACLATFRELIDTICAPNGTGALFIFTTRHGLKVVQRYPALKERLFAAERFSLPNTSWDMNRLSMWDSARVIDVLLDLYRSAAREGDPVAARVAAAASEELARPEVRRHVEAVIRAPTPARMRLKHLTVEIFDPMSEGRLKITDAPEQGPGPGGVRDDQSAAAATAVDTPTEIGSARQVLREAATVRPPYPWKSPTEIAPAAPSAPPHAFPPAEEATIPAAQDTLGVQAAWHASCGEQEPDPLAGLNPTGDVPDGVDEVMALLADQPPLLATAEETPHARKPAYVVYHRAKLGGSDLERDRDAVLLAIRKRSPLPTIARRIATLRDGASFDELSDVSIENFRVRVRKVLTRRSLGLHALPEPSDAFARLTEFLRASIEAPHTALALMRGRLDTEEPFDPQEPTGGYRVVAVNPFFSVGVLRSFVYQWMIQQGHLPSDLEIDAFVIQTAQTFVGMEPVPARGGVRFNLPDQTAFFRKAEAIYLDSRPIARGRNSS